MILVLVVNPLITLSWDFFSLCLSVFKTDSRVLTGVTVSVSTNNCIGELSFSHQERSDRAVANECRALLTANCYKCEFRVTKNILTEGKTAGRSGSVLSASVNS